MNKVNYLFMLLRSLILYSWRFKKIGGGVSFGYLNRIIGGRYIEIGSGSSFGNNLRLEAIAKYEGNIYNPKLIVGNNVAINQNFHCTCAKEVNIGSGTSITANCGVFDIIHPFEDIYMNPRAAQIITKPVKIGKDCLIGMNSVILPGTQIGNHCVVGANSTVSGVFPDYCVIVGSPARIIKQYDVELKTWVKL